MNSKTSFSHLNLVLICVLLSLGGNHVLAKVFGDHIAAGGEGARVAEKEPVPEYLQSVVSCKLGEPHRQYPECRCGERVEIVPVDEIPFESLGDYHLRDKHTHRGTIREIYYHCLFCSQCLDGVRILSNCSRMIDTQCTSSCIKATDIFDKGRKACVPDPRFEEEPTKPTDQTNLLNVEEVQAEGERTNRPSQMRNSDNHTPNGSSGKSLLLADDKYLLIVGWALVAAVVIVLIVNIFICKYFYNKRKDDQGGEKGEEQETQDLISSKSNESVIDEGR
eukprot:XP_011660465.1 PREDICTED: uncharacterized protein LOC105436540 isoform X1 [Strongylocentrotus purpuratus]